MAWKRTRKRGICLGMRAWEGICLGKGLGAGCTSLEKVPGVQPVGQNLAKAWKRRENRLSGMETTDPGMGEGARSSEVMIKCVRNASATGMSRVRLGMRIKNLWDDGD